MTAYIHYEADGSYAAFRLDSTPKDYPAGAKHFDDEGAFRKALVQQLVAWQQLHLSWRHLLANGSITTYLLVKARQRMTPKTLDLVSEAFQALVALTPVEDAAEFQRARSPFGRKTYVVEIRQGSAEVSFAAGKVSGKELVAVVPFLFQPGSGDWDIFSSAAKRANAPILLSVLCIPSALTAEEEAECNRLARVASGLTYFSSREGQVHDLSADHAANLFATLPGRLSNALLLIVQAASPSKEVAQAISKRWASSCISRSQDDVIPSDYTLHAPRSQDDLNSAYQSLEKLEFAAWGDMLVSPGLQRMPYLTTIEGGSAVVRLESSGITAQIGEITVTKYETNYDFSGANISNSNFMTNINSTLTNVSQTIGHIPNADADTKKQLEELVKQLGEALKAAPADKAEDAEAVATLTEEVVAAADKPKPNKKVLEIKGEALKQAAENIKAVIPLALPLATQLVVHVLKLASGG